MTVLLEEVSVLLEYLDLLLQDLSKSGAYGMGVWPMPFAPTSTAYVATAFIILLLLVYI